jgi:hypothetical protein
LARHRTPCSEHRIRSESTKPDDGGADVFLHRAEGASASGCAERHASRPTCGCDWRAGTPPESFSATSFPRLERLDISERRYASSMREPEEFARARSATVTVSFRFAATLAVVRRFNSASFRTPDHARVERFSVFCRGCSWSSARVRRVALSLPHPPRTPPSTPDDCRSPNDCEPCAGAQVPLGCREDSRSIFASYCVNDPRRASAASGG